MKRNLKNKQYKKRRTAKFTVNEHNLLKVVKAIRKKINKIERENYEKRFKIE
jgi:hypothetical protein